MNLQCPIQSGELPLIPHSNALIHLQGYSFRIPGFCGSPYFCGTAPELQCSSAAPQLRSPAAEALLSSVNVSTAAPHSLNLSSSPPWHRITILPFSPLSIMHLSKDKPSLVRMMSQRRFFVGSFNLLAKKYTMQFYESARGLTTMLQIISASICFSANICMRCLNSPRQGHPW